MDSWKDAKTLGERLRWAREEALGLPSTHATERFWEDLPEAERPGDYGFMSVGRYEANKRVPRLDYVVKLAQRSGVSLLWMATGEGGPWDQPGGLASRKLELVRRIVTLPAPDEGAARDAARLDEMLARLETAVGSNGTLGRAALEG